MNGLSKKEQIIFFWFLCFWCAILCTILSPLTIIYLISRSIKLENLLFKKPVRTFINWLEK